jgi:hypothetical protein
MLFKVKKNIFLIHLKSEYLRILLTDLPIKTWGKKFLDDVELAKNYIKSANHATEENLNSW